MFALSSVQVKREGKYSKCSLLQVQPDMDQRLWSEAPKSALSAEPGDSKWLPTRAASLVQAWGLEMIRLDLANAPQATSHA